MALQSEVEEVTFKGGTIDGQVETTMTTRQVGLAVAVVAALAFGGCAGSQAQEEYDVVIRGGTLLDGTGAPASVGDLAIRGDRVVALGQVNGVGKLTIDATGLMVAPGFVDMHAHSDPWRLRHAGHGPSFAYQGITTEVFGEYGSPGPFGGKMQGGLIEDESIPKEARDRCRTLGGCLDFMESQGSSANFASYVGSGAVRAYVMGYVDRAPTTEELDQMRAVVRQAMHEGAIGVSSGMSYVPNIYMSTDELAALVREAAGFGGIYATHARTMNGTDPNAVREAIDVGRKAGADVHFHHLNSTAGPKAGEFLAIIDSARSGGMNVTGNSYTYTWGITPLSAYIPAWAQEGGRQAMLKRLADPSDRQRIAKGFVSEPPYLANVGWHHVRLGVSDKAVNGKLVSEVAADRRQSPEEVFMDVVLAAKGEGIVIDWNNEEETLRQVLQKPYVAAGTDGSALALDWQDLPPLIHPRHMGTIPRWLGTYVRDEKMRSWEEAVRRLAALPFEILKIPHRGTLRVGNFADVVIFDSKTIDGRATFEQPNHYAVGMRYVLVNGVPVVKDGKYTAALPGRALRGAGYQKSPS
ncbi:MAG: amidohydrolase family protein [Acidobacteria bacterium]|nr:amidohydrolase family protein [Acidobacteriota bacterium]